MAADMSSTAAEYQHYIPQFLLKNFAYPFECPRSEDGGKKRKGKKCKCKHEKGKYPNDLVLNCVNLTATPFHHEVRPVKRVFGLSNMYDDKAKPTTAEQRRIETRFGKMESQASTIFRRMIKAQESGEPAIMLTRIERDTVRKFLFLLKYRGQGFHNRFDHGSVDEYSANDRTLMVEYMERKGFKTPLDVWFHNLEAIMDIHMDPERHWIFELPEKMFPPDAHWFVSHAQSYYMALCTPHDEKEEFILTDTCFNVFEGPNTFVRDQTSGEIISASHAGYHQFAPIGPRLMIILRCSVLPNPLEDADPKARRDRENQRWFSFGQVYGPHAESFFEDLPVHKAKSSCTRIINGGCRPAEGFDGKYRPNDTFTFNLFRIEHRHIMIMNNMLLDNAYTCTALGFKSHDAFFNTLESYIAGPCDSAKVIGGTDADLRLGFLRKLEALARNMGSTKPLTYSLMESLPTVDKEEFMKRQDTFQFMGFPKDGENETRETFRGFLQLYADIGNVTQPTVAYHENSLLTRLTSLENLRIEEAFSPLQTDLSQSGRMMHLEMMMRSSRLGLDQRMLLKSYYRNCSLGRFWLYMKQVRRLGEGKADSTQDFVDFYTNPSWQNGPEDVLAKGESSLPAATYNKGLKLKMKNS